MNEKRKQGFLFFIPIFILFLCMTYMAVFCLRTYQQNTFKHISAFFQTAAEADPKSEPQLLSALKECQSLSEEEVDKHNYLEKYGYHKDDFCRGLPVHIFALFFSLFFISASAFAWGIWRLCRQTRRRITYLTEYLEQVNTGADGTFIQMQEDDFSHLQDEIYKTVTMLYQTREEAIAARERFAENLTNIAHQLKTPITAAFLSLQLMKKASQNEYALQVEKQLERLNRLEESLLTLSKIDAGTLPLKFQKVDIYTALTLAAENLNDLLSEKNVSVVIPEKGGMEFSGDLEWSMEALINLMKNCMEHSPSGGHIYCDYTENPLYAQILIWDEGTGFVQGDIPHLFERFYQGRNGTPNGSGIGLALARSIFELQNGTVTARNIPEGGACFEIKIYSH